MKGLTKQELVDLIDFYYIDCDVIFEDEIVEFMKQHGHDWFINRETKKWEQLD